MMMQAAARPQPSFFSSFSRSQVSSLIASIVDYGVLFFFTEFLHIWYVIATASGAFLGAVTNFLINRNWSFRATHGSWGAQAKRYALVSAGSLGLNTLGVYVVTEYLRFHYAISVAIVSFLVGILFNYPLHRHFVYRAR
jgi:putative flippase GtrA